MTNISHICGQAPRVITASRQVRWRRWWPNSAACRTSTCGPWRLTSRRSAARAGRRPGRPGGDARRRGAITGRLAVGRRGASLRRRLRGLPRSGWNVALRRATEPGVQHQPVRRRARQPPPRRARRDRGAGPCRSRRHAGLPRQLLGPAGGRPPALPPRPLRAPGAGVAGVGEEGIEGSGPERALRLTAFVEHTT